LPAASLHGSINALWGFTIFVTQTSNNEIIGGLGFLGIVTWLTTASLFVYYGKLITSVYKKILVSNG
jgi:hypothetical protein